MNSKQCLKCGHVVELDGAPPTACPKCGAIYSKVEAAFAPPSPAIVEAREEARAYAFRHSQHTFESVSDIHSFAATMRDDSLYPTWRGLVKWITWFWYFVAICILLGGIVAGVKSGGGLSILWALVIAAVIVVFARIGKELSLMLTDLSDAAVRMAANQESRRPPA